jgi:molecular chaperone GrpE (heat shock protein)
VGKHEISNMKTNTPKHKQNGNAVTTESLIAKAAATKKLAKAAREHLKLVKAEFKEARKAFKQAKKAARRARKEAKAALKMLNGKVIKAVERAKAPAKPAKAQASRSSAGRATVKTNGGHSLTLPMLSTVAPHDGARAAAQT